VQIEIFDSGLRFALQLSFGGALLAMVVLTLLRRQRIAALVAIAAGLLGLTLIVEALTQTLVLSAAPSSVDFNQYRWIFLSPWGRRALILGALAGMATVVLTAMATRHIHSPWRWSLIVSLRAAAVMTALVLFVQPAIELRQVAREPNRIAILVDDSMSMELADQRGKASRREQTKELLRASKQVIEKWGESHIIDFYKFSDELVRSRLEAIGSTASEGKATLLRHALEQIRRRYEGDELAGVMVLSDGVVTGDLAELGAGEFRDFAKELDAPVHTVWTGNKGLKDLAVSDIRADEFAFVRTVTRIEAVVQSTGYKKRRVPVTLSSDGVAMRRKWVEVGPGRTSAVVAFEFTPPHVGKYVYKVSVPVDEEEAVVENNSSWFVVRVIRDKIRVLQVAGQPSWDVRALRGMLKQNPNVDLISFFILRTPDDIKKAGNDELSLIPFPTRELFEQELPSFDLVVLQNFNYGPYGIGRYLENIRSYVEGGGGLMMLGGPLSFSSGGYAGTPVAKVLPVALIDGLAASADSSKLLDSERFRPKLTSLGGIHPVTALRYEANDNRELWKELPPLEGVNKVLRAKKDASVLAVHPTLRDSSNQAMPVIVAGNYKEGRSLAVTTDSLWRWGFVAASESGNDGRHYLKLWDNAIRWLIQDPELRYLHVNSDKNTYSPGSTVRLNLRLLDQDYSPMTDGEIVVKVSRGFDPNALEQVSTVSLKVGGNGEVSHELLKVDAGVYRVHAQSSVRGREVIAQDIFLVHEATTEHLQPAADDAVLRMVSQLSGGEHLEANAPLPSDLRFIAPKVVRVDKRSDVPLWSRSWLLLFALAALGLEWLLRQRSGTL
jgi:uncharacterized membrane protein